MAKEESAIVIGGGLGGLSAAITLQQRGIRVKLYDKNNHLGGKLNRKDIDGFGFDLGPSLLTMPKIFERLFQRSGKQLSDYVTLTEITHQWRAFFEDDTIIDLHRDLNTMRENNPNLTKEDMDDYEAFLTYAKTIDRATEKGYFDKGIDDLKGIIKEHGPIGALKDFDYFHTMQQGIDKRVKNQHLRDMLGYFIKYVGSSSYDAPAVLNMMAHMQHEQGVWYVEGGLQRLAEAITTLAKEIGVEIYNGVEVTSVSTDKKRITQVNLSNGEAVSADHYVSNMEVLPFYRKLLDIDIKHLPKLEEKFEPAASGYVIHLGVDKHYDQLRHHNFFFSKDSKKNYAQVFKEKVLPEDPTIYLVKSNVTDDAQAPTGCDNIKILPHIPPLRHNDYTEADYTAFRETVLDKLERMGLTDLRKHIVVEHTLNPHDIERMYHSDHGAIYGTLSDKRKNKGFKHPKRSDVLNNLYFVGGTVNPGGGMPMVTLSGQQVGDMIAKRDEDK